VTRVAILGGGPAGVGAAWRLARDRKAAVTLFERNSAVGGNAGSFDRDGHRLDYGSHRLHPACAPEILADIRAFLGEDLLDRPRHGRIRLLGKWVHFPLKPADLLLHLDKGFALASARHAVAKPFLKETDPAEESFATVLERNLGPAMCHHFYFPYARKIWGADPTELSAIQAKKRVSAGSFAKLARKLLNSVPGMKPPGAGRFFYPRGGYGAISEAYAESASDLGAEVMLGWTVNAVERRGSGWRVSARRGDEERTVDADHVWSTLPITVLAKILRPETPREILAAAERIGYRAMLLVYVEIGVDRFSEYDAHYFPGADVTTTRMSEPKNYAVRTEPRGRTVLCAELPCAVGDRHWNASEAELGRIVEEDLRTCGLALPRKPLQVFVRRLPQAYPIYQRGYEKALEPLDRWMGERENLLSYGRQGLFAHDNTHHALAMAYAAVECLSGNRFDRERWREHREVFATHVVED
jgi:protoporphyrinogen oxidase